MKRWMLHLAVFAAGAAIAAFAWPQDKPLRRHGLSGIYDELGLTPTVAVELRKLDEKVGPRCMAIAENRRALYAEISRERPDAAALAASLDAIAKIRSEIQKDVVDHLLAVKPLLTPEKRAQLFDRLTAGETK